jgi:hypothetical protein
VRKNGAGGIMIKVVHEGSAVARPPTKIEKRGFQKMKMTSHDFEILHILINFAER